MHTDAVLIPESQVRRQPRLANAQLIARSATVQMTASERMRIELHVLSEGVCTIADCAELVSCHSDPFGLVLALVGRKRIGVKLDRPITPHSLVWPADADH